MSQNEIEKSENYAIKEDLINLFAISQQFWKGRHMNENLALNGWIFIMDELKEELQKQGDIKKLSMFGGISKLKSYYKRERAKWRGRTKRQWSTDYQWSTKCQQSTER